MTQRVDNSRRPPIRPIILRDDAEERFWKRVSPKPVKANECWDWMGRLVRGYGQFGQGKVRYYAHRVSYALFVGPIPDGLMIDHTCRNRGCVNPDHLELVTNAENIERAPWSAVQLQGDKSHCPSGHAYDEANTYHWRNERHCRACARENQRKYRARRREYPNGPARVTVTITPLQETP